MELFKIIISNAGIKCYFWNEKNIINMKYIIRGSFILIFVLPFLLFGQNVNQDAQKLVNKAQTSSFIENKGQWPTEVMYLARIGGMNAWITNSGVLYDYYKTNRNYKSSETSKMPESEQKEFEKNHTSIKGQVVAILLNGAKMDSKSLPSGKQQGYFNYIKGNNSEKWATYVQQYSEVLLENIYPGIDIRYYFDNGLLRYDYIAKSGADLSQIILKIDGSNGYNVNQKGELTLNTNLGNIIHGKLYAFQQIGNEKTEVSCTFTKNKEGDIGLKAGSYNPTFDLVIDPLIYSTFIGGTAEEYTNSIAVDGISNAYITGYSRSADYPTKTGAYDTSFNFANDVFVTKLNEPGSTMVFSTYIGSDSNETGNSIAVDNSGNVYITGLTQSANYPVTSAAFDTIYHGGSNFGGDGFVTKLDSTGTKLIYSTFLGGLSNDMGKSIVLDNQRNAYVTGYTKSTDFPTTAGAFSDSLVGIRMDVFVTKINSLGSALIFSTLLGGNDDDVGNSIAIDGIGNIYIAGYTGSTNYPVTLKAIKTTFSGGFQDAFVTKLNAIGTRIIYSTYLGGNSLDVATSLAVDNSGNVFVTGNTISSNFPKTIGAFDTSTNGIVWDVFVAKLNYIGQKFIYSTFLGGDNDDLGNSIAIDDKGNAFVTGKTLSPNFPTSSDAFDKSFNGDSTNWADGFVTILNPKGDELIYSTYLGGTDEDGCTALALDVIGTAFITGNSMSANFPLTANVYDVSQNGDWDAFVSCFYFPAQQATDISFKNITGVQANISWKKGTGSKRAVFISKASTTMASPIGDSTYIANNSFMLGSQISSSGWYCVYNDTGSSVVVKGFEPLTTYKVMVCEYIGIAGNEHYNTDSANKNPSSFTTIYATPTIQASNIVFNNLTDSSFTITFNKGNGTKRVAFIKIAASGTANPANNISYVGNSTFGLGTPLGFSGWYCVYNDTGNLINISKLLPGKTYRVMLCEYNGVPGREQYLTDTATVNPANQLIVFPKPTVQASEIILTSTINLALNFSFTRGNGKSCIILITDDASATTPPLIDHTSYAVNSEVDTSGWFCIYKGALNKQGFTGLTKHAYRIMVCEYNGTAGFERYNTDSTNNNPKFFVNPNGIIDPLESKIKIYPNPTSGEFLIENAKSYSLKLFNNIGKEVFSIIVADKKSRVDLKDVRDGIYFLRLEGEGKLINQKLILKR